MSFEERLREQATKGLDITERVLNGDADVPDAQRKTALSIITGQLKSQAVSNGRITQIISLTKLGVRDAETRERIALTALRDVLPIAAIAGRLEVLDRERSGDDAKPAGARELTPATT